MDREGHGPLLLWKDIQGRAQAREQPPASAGVSPAKPRHLGVQADMTPLMPVETFID